MRVPSRPPVTALSRALAVSLVLALAACDASGPEAVAVQTEDARLALGETAVVDGLRITFVEVEGDSRCPRGVVCIWEGVADVALVVEGEPYSLSVVDPEMQPEAGVQVGGRVVFAVALTPYPQHGVDPSNETPVVEVATFEADA